MGCERFPAFCEQPQGSFLVFSGFFLWVLGAFPKQWPNIPRQLLARCSNLLNPVRVCRGVLLQPFLCCVLVLASVCTGTELLCS